MNFICRVRQSTRTILYILLVVYMLFMLPQYSIYPIEPVSDICSIWIRVRYNSGAYRIRHMTYSIILFNLTDLFGLRYGLNSFQIRLESYMRSNTHKMKPQLILKFSIQMHLSTTLLSHLWLLMIFLFNIFIHNIRFVQKLMQRHYRLYPSYLKRE